MIWQLSQISCPVHPLRYVHRKENLHSSFLLQNEKTEYKDNIILCTTNEGVTPNLRQNSLLSSAHPELYRSIVVLFLFWPVPKYKDVDPFITSTTIQDKYLKLCITIDTSWTFDYSVLSYSPLLLSKRQKQEVFVFTLNHECLMI